MRLVNHAIFEVAVQSVQFKKSGYYGKFLIGIFLLLVACNVNNKLAEAKKVKTPVIIYISHDNRPISAFQTVETVRCAGYKVKIPPDYLLGNNSSSGDPDGLYKWLLKNASDSTAAIISTDALLYGSLVESRKHNFSHKLLKERVERFKTIHEKYPKLKLYVFSSIMRTPRSSLASGNEEPRYYVQYGGKIFRYTELLDKRSSVGLQPREVVELSNLEREIPAPILADWFNRRKKNLQANEELIDLTKKNVFTYFSLSCDDNAPFSQTHYESLQLKKYAANLSATQFQIMDGIDEVGLLLLTRSINQLRHARPVVAVEYAPGYGGATIPKYSDEPINTSVYSEIITAGGQPTSALVKDALVLLVNTDISGKTKEVGSDDNGIYAHQNTAAFINMIENYVQAGKKVAVADIAYANGADNALMNGLYRHNLLFKINAYAGWNTATNSTGWAIAQGLLSLDMSKANKDDLLMLRYLDDWAYQANVRERLQRRLSIYPGHGNRYALGEKEMLAKIDADYYLQEFADKYFAGSDIKTVDVSFPWHRLFEININMVE